MAIALSVNLNKVALVRNSREDNNPDITHFAKLAIGAGAKGLTAHPRPDQRHIRPDDIPALARVAKYSGVEFNVEGNPFAAARGSYPGLLELVENAVPNQCTLVPDSDKQLTSDHGFHLDKDFERLGPIVERLKSQGVRVSLFMDPDLDQISKVKTIGADRIELYTGPFAMAFHRSRHAADAVFETHAQAARHAQSLGLGVNAGHDLNLKNLTVYRHLPALQEVSIGHALTADALEMGFSPAVSAYAKLCE